MNNHEFISTLTEKLISGELYFTYNGNIVMLHLPNIKIQNGVIEIELVNDVEDENELNFN